MLGEGDPIVFEWAKAGPGSRHVTESPVSMSGLGCDERAESQRLLILLSDSHRQPELRETKKNKKRQTTNSLCEYASSAVVTAAGSRSSPMVWWAGGQVGRQAGGQGGMGWDGMRRPRGLRPALPASGSVTDDECMRLLGLRCSARPFFLSLPLTMTKTSTTKTTKDFIMWYRERRQKIAVLRQAGWAGATY